MIDFGLSKHFSHGDVQHEAVGTPYTVAPEVILGSYDEKCDVWAMGVITFLLLSGTPPFGGCGGMESLSVIRDNILRGEVIFEPNEIWRDVSESAKDFILAMLVSDPHKRPSAVEVQSHSWLHRWDDERSANVLSPSVVRSLVKFKEMDNMQKLISEVLSFTLLPEQIGCLREEFERADTEGCGEISFQGLKKVLNNSVHIGPLTEDEISAVFS